MHTFRPLIHSLGTPGVFSWTEGSVCKKTFLHVLPKKKVSACNWYNPPHYSPGRLKEGKRLFLPCLIPLSMSARSFVEACARFVL